MRISTESKFINKKFAALEKQLEAKMIPSPLGRDRSESPKLALTRIEQLQYADILEARGHHKSAEFFRLEGDYGLNRQKEKKEKSKSK